MFRGRLCLTVGHIASLICIVPQWAAPTASLIYSSALWEQASIAQTGKINKMCRVNAGQKKAAPKGGKVELATLFQRIEVPNLLLGFVEDVHHITCVYVKE